MTDAKRSITTAAKSRRGNRAYYDMVVGDGDLAGLAETVRKAETFLNATRLAKLDDEAKKADLVASAQAAYDDASAVLESHRERIWFEALSAVEYEQLRLAHPVPTADEQQSTVMWSLIPALIAACAVDYDSSPEEWATELATWSRAEQEAITAAVTEANLQPAAKILGKG